VMDYIVTFHGDRAECQCGWEGPYGDAVLHVRWPRHLEWERKSKPKANAEYVLDTVTDLVSSFLYYDRKDDEELPWGRIEELIESGELTVQAMVERFAFALRKRLRQ
jgi:hypothetical protein